MQVPAHLPQRLLQLASSNTAAFALFCSGTAATAAATADIECPRGSAMAPRSESIACFCVAPLQLKMMTFDVVMTVVTSVLSYRSPRSP